VTVETDLPDQTIQVLADSVQIQQVIVNLISNACDAMVSQPVFRRKLWIRVADDKEQPFIEILDNGPGLTDDTQDQVFDPFYTSKPNGMGMGLTICSDVVISHFGTITAENVPDHGALFRLSLPRPKEATDE
jgi:two-component system sensor kinase FixL